MKTEVLRILRSRGGAVSGQELCEKFGVSRTAIWKVIGQLKDEGYEIESVTNRGYELKSVPDRLTRHELESRLADCEFGRTVLAFDRVPSTNQVLKENMDERPHGMLAIAEEQTMGKGRRGRAWQSPPGTGIWMSLLLKNMRQPELGPMVTIVAALAVERAIGETLGDVRIKWPNDIVIRGKKVCGILTEMSAEVDYVHGIVVGIGINVHQTEFPEELSETATSLYLETGKHFSRPELVERILRHFEKLYELFLRDGDVRSLCEEYNGALVNAGEKIRVIAGEESFTGIGQGIDSRGRLLVQTDGGVRTVRSGEVSVRGVYGYV